MDILKQELLKKRQSLSEETGGRKVFNRSEIERKRIQKRRREADSKRLCQNQNQNPSYPNSSSNPNFKLDSTKSKPGSSSKALISDEQKLDLPKKKVIRWFDNVRGSSGMDHDVCMKTNFSELCDEDKIVVFFKKLLIEWNQELDEMTESEKMTAKGKSTLATFKLCVRDLNPLFKFCRKKVLDDDIKQALMLVVNCCMKRDHSAAFDHYYNKIAIGKSAWPIGVTMVGIHERSAREKINTKTVAHVMNDETTRKYLTSVKRLMTFCQSRHHVEFNSLANGRP